MNSQTIKKPTIICVDDEKIILDALNRQLQRHFGDQYEYEFCESAEEALSLIEELTQDDYKVIMVISDQIMPGISGDEFLINVQQKYPDTIKILLTGQASLDSAIQAINKANLYRYIKKPWNESDFLLTVAKGLQEYNLLECTIKQAEVFEKFFPKKFLECLSRKDILDVQLSDHAQLEMSIMFTDIRHFTTISESMGPEESYSFINNYLSYVEPVIQQNNGFVEKYLGDAVIALFHHADDALKSAVDLQLALTKFNEDNKEKPYAPISVGIGMHSGMLMLGIVGVESHMQGIVISDAVNAASRLQDLAGKYELSVVVSDEFINRCTILPEAGVHQRFLGEALLKGKRHKTKLSEVILQGSSSDADLKVATIADFEEGVRYFQAQQFAQACVKFKSVSEVNPQDKVTQMYLKLSAEYMLKGVPENWDCTAFVV